MKNFQITDGKGFCVKFANGYSISVQFGPGNYCDHKDRIFSDKEKTKCGAQGSNTAEIAILNPKNEYISNEAIGVNCDWAKPEGMLKIMNWITSLA